MDLNTKIFSCVGISVLIALGFIFFSVDFKQVSEESKQNGCQSGIALKCLQVRDANSIKATHQTPTFDSFRLFSFAIFAIAVMFLFAAIITNDERSWSAMIISGTVVVLLVLLWVTQFAVQYEFSSLCYAKADAATCALVEMQNGTDRVYNVSALRLNESYEIEKSK